MCEAGHKEETFIRVTRLYTGPDGESHFEDLDIPLTDHGSIGWMSALIPATGLILRETDSNYDYDWHPAPRRQAVLMLAGAVEMRSGMERSGALGRERFSLQRIRQGGAIGAVPSMARRGRPCL